MSPGAATATIVVPCYNEELRLDLPAFRRFAADHPEIGFLFVDDGSVDGTRALLASFCAADPHGFALLALPHNVGKAEAVRRGVLAALESGAHYVGFWDADLATPLEAIPTFRAVLEARPKLEVVVGSRVRLLGRGIERRARRHYLGRVFATAASLALGVAVYDTQCGAKLFRDTPGVRSLFAEPFRSRWIFDVELFARLVRRRVLEDGPPVREIVYELPLDCWTDVAGSRLRGGDFVRAAVELGEIWWTYLRPGARAAEPLPLADGVVLEGSRSPGEPA